MADKKTDALGSDPLAWLHGVEVDQSLPGDNADTRQTASEAYQPGTESTAPAIEPAAPVQDNAVASPHLLELSRRPGIAEVAAMRAELLEARRASRPTVVDAARVESMDTASLQLLLALFRNSDEEAVRWLEVSPALRQLAVMLGLSDPLRIPPEA